MTVRSSDQERAILHVVATYILVSQQYGYCALYEAGMYLLLWDRQGLRCVNRVSSQNAPVTHIYHVLAYTRSHCRRPIPDRTPKELLLDADRSTVGIITVFPIIDSDLCTLNMAGDVALRCNWFQPRLPRTTAQCGGANMVHDVVLVTNATFTHGPMYDIWPRKHYRPGCL